MRSIPSGRADLTFLQLSDVSASQSEEMTVVVGFSPR